jgi:signal transduction histidine kinase
LEGFEDSWTAASNHRAAYYTNLPPGQYRFHVIARDSATPLQVSEAVIPLVWQPHFYQTAWLYGLGGTLVGLCGWAALRFYARQTKARYDLLLAERTRLAREMHDTVIQGCVGVSTLLEAASAFQQSNAARSKELVDQARVQVRLTLDEAREAVWDLRRDHIEGDITGTLHDLARQLTTENGIPIEVEFVGSPPAIQQQTLRSILLVAREAIRNAAHHGLPKQIRIQMSFETQEVRLEVMDDGRGFAPAAEPEDANGHYGIVGMRERVEQLGGSFLVRSSPGQGTSVVARLPVGAG